MAAQNIGSRGPRVGEALTVQCPVTDSLRSVYLWTALILLLWRKENRTRAAWAILVPLVTVDLLLALAESQLNRFFVFHHHQYLCSTCAQLLSFFALSLAILLTAADLSRLRSRLLHFLLVYLFLFLVAVWQITPNPQPLLPMGAWVAFYGVFLFAFMLSQAVLKTLLRSLIKPARVWAWYTGFCLVFGLLPVLVLGGIEWSLDRSRQPQSSLEFYRFCIMLSAAVCLPWLVYFCFMVLARRNRFYAERFADAFGISPLLSPPEDGQKPVPKLLTEHGLRDQGTGECLGVPRSFRGWLGE